MILTINGEEREFDEGLGLPEILSKLGLQDKPVVIEHNEQALAPSDFPACQPQDGDRLEIITIAAGG